MSVLCRFIKLNQRPFWPIGWLTLTDRISSDAYRYLMGASQFFGLVHRSRHAIGFGGIAFCV